MKQLSRGLSNKALERSSQMRLIVISGLLNGIQDRDALL
jgi:hypothetical protein